MRRYATLTATALISTLLVAGQAAVAGEGEVRRFYVENDYFDFFGENSDRYYTQGMRYEVLGAPREQAATYLPGMTIADWCRALCDKGAEGAQAQRGYAVGQNMYTPADITIAAPQPNDRPWGGYLYASRVARVSYRDSRLPVQRRDQIEATLGIVGPASLAAPTQIEWHRRIGADRPEGWDNQLRNEPIVQMRHEGAVRWPADERVGVGADVISRAGINFGNALTSIEAGMTARLGWNLRGFGVDPIPGAPLLLLAEQRQPTRWLQSGSLFFRAGSRAVAHNIFLDGNTFATNDVRIHRTPVVPEVAVGAEINIVGRLWLTYQYIHRGSEFETRRHLAAPGHRFGSISIALVSSP